MAKNIYLTCYDYLSTRLIVCSDYIYITYIHTSYIEHIFLVAANVFHRTHRAQPMSTPYTTYVARP